MPNTLEILFRTGSLGKEMFCSILLRYCLEICAFADSSVLDILRDILYCFNKVPMENLPFEANIYSYFTTFFYNIQQGYTKKSTTYFHDENKDYVLDYSGTEKSIFRERK